jgi:urease
METNSHLEFDRLKAYGYHLDLPSGEFMRFEPNEPKTVTIVQIGGFKIIQGGSGHALGPIHDRNASKILQALRQSGYLHSEEASNGEPEPEPISISRSKYAASYGPTTGDSLRLGSTDLWIKIEKDYTTYGDECTLGCGKSIRDGMGAASGCSDADCLDLAIINAVVIDWTGIYKADIGVKDGVIIAIGKAGNPAAFDGVSRDMIIGSNTDIIDAGGKIITAGGIDTHVHHICPQQANDAIASGVTTLIGGGTGPSTSSAAVNSTTSKRYIKQMMQAFDNIPLNIGLVGKGADSGAAGLRDQCQAGIIALKLHEDFGCTPATIDNCLRYGDLSTTNEMGSILIVQTVSATSKIFNVTFTPMVSTRPLSSSTRYRPSRIVPSTCTMSKAPAEATLLITSNSWAIPTCFQVAQLPLCHIHRTRSPSM